ncbi:hypothetical protein CRG98_035454 [Punica granatum]|uniref:BURP domain-containing protein n=1 Tax=Punica granatum TaxID=22663 RepID=A0A2I0IJF8_PUNGR|nr:hypothetical protein CRG98_035454 [Punica granatum]
MLRLIARRPGLFRDFVIVHAMNNVAGFGKDILIRKVSIIYGSNASYPLSCHQVMYLHLVYYRHSIPRATRWISWTSALRPKSTRGFIVCQLNTSTWSSNHEAFRIIEFSQIEVCHWIYEANMIRVRTLIPSRSRERWKQLP